jgi:hypothetical protein
LLFSARSKTLKLASTKSGKAEQTSRGLEKDSTIGKRNYDEERGERGREG